MRITVMDASSSDISTFEVADDMELENLIALCRMEFNIPAHMELGLSAKQRMLVDPKQTLTHYDVKDGDMLLLHKTSVSQPAGAATGSSAARARPMLPTGPSTLEGGGKLICKFANSLTTRSIDSISFRFWSGDIPKKR